MLWLNFVCENEEIHLQIQFFQKCPLQFSNLTIFRPVICFQLVHSSRFSRWNRWFQIKCNVSFPTPQNILIHWPLKHVLAFFHKRYLVNVTVFVIRILIYYLSNIPSTFVLRYYKLINAVRHVIHTAGLSLCCINSCIFRAKIFFRDIFLDRSAFNSP